MNEDEKNPQEGGAVETPTTTETEIETSQDPIKEERQRIEKKDKLTKHERLLFAKKQIEEQLAEEESKIDPNTPVTVAMLEQRDREKVKETSLTLADEIADEDERVVVKEYLQSRIVPSDNPRADVAAARALVNSLKNGRIAEELARKSTAHSHSSGGGAPAKPSAGAFEPTAQELVFMRPPYSLTQEQIIEARKKQSQT